MVTREMVEEAYKATENSYKAAALIGISPTHFKRLMHKYMIPFVPISVQRRKPRHHWVPNPSRELSYVLGVLKGDGHVTSVTAGNGNGSRILLQVTDGSFALKFQDALKSIGIKPHKMGYRKRYGRHKSMFVVSATCKAFAMWYHSLDIKQIAEYIKGYEDGFVCGFYESDGHLIVSGNDIDISIAKPYKDLIDLTANILKSWGMHPRTYCYRDNRDERRLPMYRVCLFRQAEVLDFFARVKPVIRVPAMLTPSQAGPEAGPGVCRD